MDRDKYIDELTFLSTTFKYQLGSEYLSHILSQCKMDANNVKALLEAREEINQRYNDKYDAMNMDYWNGVKYAFEVIRKHMEALNG